MATIRELLLERLWNGREPFDGQEADAAADFQGWASDHPYLRQAIVELRPAIVVEVGVWKGSSVITLAEEIR